MKKLTDSQLAQILWDYHYLGHQPTKADCILGLGSEDLRVADYCAQLYKEEFAPLIVFSGNIGNFTRGVFKEPEAHLFRKQALACGVPSSKILIEDAATNTGKNILLTRKLLQEKAIACTTLIMATKPHLQRRTYATAKKVWPEVNAIILSPPITFDKQPTAWYTQVDMINQLVGDLQRIRLYPQLGYQVPQEIPKNVWQAYLELIERGYTKHLMSAEI